MDTCGLLVSAFPSTKWKSNVACFIAAVARIYRDLIVVIKIEKEIVELPQTVEVRQGDNMAPVLFLFLMYAFA